MKAMSGAKAIFRREIQAGRNAWLAWTIPVCLLILLVMWVYPSVVASGAAWDQYLNQLPEQFRLAFGLDRLNITDPIGFFATEGYLFIQLLGGMYAAILGATLVSKEEAEKTAEFLLTKPVRRSSVVTGKLAAGLFYITLYTLVAAAVTCFSFLAFVDQAYSPAVLGRLFGGAYLVALALGALGLITSVLPAPAGGRLGPVRVRGAVPAAVGAVMGFYFLGIASGVSPRLDWLRYLSPFKYADAADIIASGGPGIFDVVVLAGVAVLAVLATYVVYGRKDIQA
ncbi:MAG TPA: ABC transporter permease subunit [Firmicutes bacterium]|nr:ABC transporter permease subunit [Bacillota bacterium]